MDQTEVISLGTQALQLSLKIALPLLLAGLVIGLVVSIFQAITQIQEQTLVFIPKILGTAAVLIVAGPWMLNEMLGYTTELWGGIPNMIGS
jgi:flagellar biosynthetic protein FliQ